MGIFYDTNQWHWIRDAVAYSQQCDTIMLRACWRDGNNIFRVDSRYHTDRARFAGLAAVGAYQRVWDGKPPEWQADFFADTTGPLQDNEWPMLDVETSGPSNPVDFCRKWLARYESRTGRSCAMYVPKALWGPMQPVIGSRLRVTPSYSHAPTWGPYDIWQDSQTAPFPGGGDAGDSNRTALTGPQIVARTSPRNRRHRQQALFL